MIVEIIAIILSVVLYGVPFYFVIINSLKSQGEAALMQISFPSKLHFTNYIEVIKADNYAVLRGFYNSTLLAVFSVAVLILVCSMLGFFIQRRGDKFARAINSLVLTGLMIPPAIVPTIWVLQSLGLFKTLPGMVLVEVALRLPFATLLYRSAVATIPRELDSAAIIDGCGKFRLFFSVIFPLLKSTTATVIILSSVSVFNDFVNPLFFFPGKQNLTVQTTLYQFTGMYYNQWHYLFADVVLISIPPLILFIFFNKRIISGMVAGAIKG